MGSRRAISALAVALLCGGGACQGEVGGEMPPVVDAGRDGRSPLDTLNGAAALDVEAYRAEYEARVTEVELGRRAEFAGIAVGTEAFVAALDTQLMTAGVGVEVAIVAPTRTSPRSVTVTGMHPGGPSPLPEPDTTDECGYAEPFVEPMESAVASCRFLVQRAVEEAYVAAVRRANEQPLGTEAFEGARDPSPIERIYFDALAHGIDGAASDVVDALRRSGACDRVYSPRRAAFDIGHRAGREAFRAAIADVLPATPLSQCDIVGEILEVARTRASTAVQAVIGVPLCPGFAATDPSAQARYDDAVAQRAAGAARGIADELAMAISDLTSSWTCAPEPPPLPEGAMQPGAPFPLDGVPLPPIQTPTDDPTRTRPRRVYYAGSNAEGDHVVCSTSGVAAVCYRCPREGLWCGSVE